MIQSKAHDENDNPQLKLKIVINSDFYAGLICFSFYYAVLTFLFPDWRFADLLFELSN